MKSRVRTIVDNRLVALFLFLTGGNYIPCSHALDGYTFYRDFLFDDSDEDCQMRISEYGPGKSYPIEFRVNDTETFPKELMPSLRAAVHFWSQTIQSRPSSQHKNVTVPKQFSPFCGFSAGEKIRVDGLFICVDYFYSDYDKTHDKEMLASARVVQIDVDDLLPRLAIVKVNLSMSGFMDYCDWTRILEHEIAHALGFNLHVFLSQALLDVHGSQLFFSGKSTMKEWSRLNATSPYPALELSSSHWNSSCFENELMAPAACDVSGPSRLTLAVFDDMGYSVDYRGANESVALLPACLESMEEADTLASHLFRLLCKEPFARMKYRRMMVQWMHQNMWTFWQRHKCNPSHLECTVGSISRNVCSALSKFTFYGVRWAVDLGKEGCRIFHRLRRGLRTRMRRHLEDVEK